MTADQAIAVPHGAPIDVVLDRLRTAPPEVVVIGELILDRWWHGSAQRMSREAPVPVVEVEELVDCPGGAGNTAANLAALGARVRVIGVVGADDEGSRILRLLDGMGVDTSDVIVAPELSTPSKTRVVGADQIVVRVDRGGRSSIPGPVRERFDRACEAVRADAEILCDYGTGLFADSTRAALAGRAQRSAWSVVDAHELAPWRSFHPDVVTPSAPELERLLGRGIGRNSDRIAVVRDAADELLARSGARSVVATLDADGTVLLRGPAAASEHGGTDAAAPHRTHARRAPEQHASGAGDTFAASLTLALAAGADLPTATDLGQRAADVVVSSPWTSVCTLDALAGADEGTATVLDLDALADELERRRSLGDRIVMTNGCFDVLHRGHTTHLRQAKRLGDVLVVALNDDESVRRLKGSDRPMNPVADRIAVLATLGCVDYVTVFSEDDAVRVLRRLRPDVYAKGGDYTPGMLAETPAVEAYGGELRILDYVPDHSTSLLVERIRSYTGPGPTGDGS